MKSFFKTAILGHLFLYLNIYIPIDIMSNFVGWLLIAYALKKAFIPLKEKQYAQYIAYILMILSVPSFFFNMDVMTVVPEWLGWLTLTAEWLSLFFYYWFFRVCLEFAKQTDAWQSTKLIASALIGVKIITILYLNAVLNIAFLEQAGWYTALFIANSIIYIWFFVYMYNMSTKRLRF